MSVAHKAARGVAWTISMSVGSRAVGLLGMLLVTRFLAPTEYGEVQVAAVLVFTSHLLTGFGLPHYIVSKPYAGREYVFCASLYFLLIGVAAFGAVLALGQPLAAAFDAPNMTRFLPGLVLAGLLERLSTPPMRILARDLRFRVVATARAVGEVVFGVVAVALAALDWGGQSIVVANIARTAINLLIVLAAAGVRDWLTPARPTRAVTRELFRFGLPIWIAGATDTIARRWDNLLVARLFGPAPVGKYNMAYNLADIPAIHVGEAVGDVLLPSFARMEPAARRDALVRSTAMLSLLMAPLAVGLGAVAPTVVSLVFDPRWHEVGPMLTILSAMAVTRPIGWTVGAYQTATDSPRAVMVLGLMRMLLVLGAMVALSPLGIYWVCAAPGLAFAIHAVASIAVVRATDRVPMRPMLAGMVRPMLACGPMVAAVLGARAGLDALGVESRAAVLAVEVAVGALAYVPAAWVFAEAASRELLRLLRSAILRRGDRGGV